MKLILIVIVALIIASALAYQVHLDPGYALITYGSWSIETSIAVLLFVSLITFTVLYFALRTVMTIKHVPQTIVSWKKQRQRNRATKTLNEGLIDSAEGNWQRSEKMLIKHAQQSETPLLNYLSAAHAAQSQGAYNRRDDYLFKAGEALPDKVHAINLTRAKLQLSAGQVEQALATLQQLKSATPKHPVVLTLLLKTLYRLNDWKGLSQLIPAIKNSRHIAPEEWQPTERATLLQLLSDPNEADAIWKSLDKKQKINPEYLVPYASQLISAGKDQLIEDSLLKGLKAGLNHDLLALYGQLNISADKKTKQLEKWLNNNGNTDLLNVLAQLCFEQELWGKTQTYLENSIAIKPTSQAYLLLGKTQEQLGDSMEAINSSYKTGLDLAQDTTDTHLTSQ